MMKFLNDQQKNTNLLIEEHDSCGILAVIEKNGKASKDNIKKNIAALIKMNHRSGFIDGEGDGSGILTDIPKKLWAETLKNHSLNPAQAYSPLFVVGHIFIERKIDVNQAQAEIRSLFSKHQITILAEQENQVDSSKLGANGKKQEPFFWQIAALANPLTKAIGQELLQMTVEIEQNTNIHVASLSNYSVVYKVLGSANVLEEYFLDLQNPLFESSSSIGHNRYSTNTLSHFFRVQPFSLLGHNGEINTIERLRDEAGMLDIPLVFQGSDSQDLNRTIEGIITKYNFSLFTTMELVFPPIYNEIRRINDDLQNLYTFLRHIWGPFSQGPAGIVSRYEDKSIFSVDALGLRPLWRVETENELYFSSEQGIVFSTEMISEPTPLAPGEKIGIIYKENEPIEIVEYHQLQRYVYNEISTFYPLENYRLKLETPKFKNNNLYIPAEKLTDSHYLAFGWEKEHIDLAKQIAVSGNEPVGSLGYDGPLAVLAQKRVNLTDFLKETVAVVTNPAIDREREIEHFSTRMILGGRETFAQHKVGDTSFEILSPLLLEGADQQDSALELGTVSLEQTISHFSDKSAKMVAVLSTTFTEDQKIGERLDQLNEEAVQAVKNGCKIIVLDDQELFNNSQTLWLDPHLALTSIDNTLKANYLKGENLRRKVSIILRSGAIRHLHDIVTAVGLGADAISPYTLFAAAAEADANTGVQNLYKGLKKGIEKVISTLGIHELRGYERLFSAIGLRQEIIDILKIVNFYGSLRIGYSLSDMEEDARKRRADFNSENGKLFRHFRLLPRIWRPLGEIAEGSASYDEYEEKLDQLESKNPVALRHILDFNYVEAPVDESQVSLSIGEHDLPFVISSMSFGSQNETAFRAYAEAAYQLNMMSLNGEGGEIRDMLGKYPKNRGVQIASGRFGVNIKLINSANWIEIKVGQGAKPGEGGHLPGTKVSEKVAAARNATPGVNLISPSNNHDVYSIEDLAQIIAELKEANKLAKIIVKVPVVPNIGTIAVGIAKAGANVISLSGYDGGTGAARVHALQHVGLPVEIGVKASHQALLSAGLRSEVEIWADGGIRSAKDLVKLVLLGANRIGFATLAMFALGCTSCRGCHLDTCHKGISTQLESLSQAEAKGVKHFSPREYTSSVSRLKNLFSAFAVRTKQITAKLGANSLQELVGRSDLLTQSQLHDSLDLAGLLQPSIIIPKALTKSIVDATYGELQMAVGAENLNELVTYSAKVDCTTRMIGSSISGERVRYKLDGKYKLDPPINYFLKKGSIPGNGLAAYLADGVKINFQGGGQDGVGKTAFGGMVSIIKAKNNHGIYLNGSVGKSFCYGAQKGLFIVQGNADSRAGIRLSGADVIIGGEITSPIQDHLGGIATRANIKGFAFEYMTNGRAVVLGDPGPWICSGMTGGVVYQRINAEFGLDATAISRRVAKGAEVAILPLDETGRNDLKELLNIYIQELVKSKQRETAHKIISLLCDLDTNFVRIIAKQQ